jgi:hypothetical protein
MKQLARGEPLSLTILNALTVFLFGMRNTMKTVGHLIAQHIRPSSMDNEFVGMTDYVMKSFYNLLARDYEKISNSDSSRGSHHSSHECFMAEGAHLAETPEGHVTNVCEGKVTPPSDPDDEVEADGRILPNPRLEQLRARQQELEDA